jgi:hypothetical protein
MTLRVIPTKRNQLNWKKHKPIKLHKIGTIKMKLQKNVEVGTPPQDIPDQLTHMSTTHQHMSTTHMATMHQLSTHMATMHQLSTQMATMHQYIITMIKHQRTITKKKMTTIPITKKTKKRRKETIKSLKTHLPTLQ